MHSLEPSEISGKIVGTLFVVVFVFVITFGITMGMAPRENGAMSGCPLMSGAASLCEMNVAEHLSRWHELFAAILGRSGTLLITLLLGLIAFPVQLRRKDETEPRLEKSGIILRRGALPPRLNDHLHRALSAGILHPKIY